MSLRRRGYLLEMDYELEDALDILHPALSDWVYRNDASAKRVLMDAYKSLSSVQRKALAKAVSKAFSRAHGGTTATLYRRMKPGQDTGRIGGRSLSAKVDRSAARHASFSVRDKDVLVHFGIPDTPLSSKAYGHEKEVILLPKASPRFIGWIGGAK